MEIHTGLHGLMIDDCTVSDSPLGACINMFYTLLNIIHSALSSAPKPAAEPSRPLLLQCRVAPFSCTDHVPGK